MTAANPSELYADLLKVRRRLLFQWVATVAIAAGCWLNGYYNGRAVEDRKYRARYEQISKDLSTLQADYMRFVAQQQSRGAR